MTGIYDDNAKSGQPPHVLAAWIQEQLADLGEGPVRRLADLRAQLQSSAFEWDATVLAQSVGMLRSAGRELRFDNLRHGWLARKLGKHKPIYERYVAAYDRIVNAVQKVKAEAAKLAGTIKAHAAGTKRTVVELDLEAKSLQSGVDQGVTWLQDMCVQINELRERGSDDAELATLAEAAQAFTLQFKSYQSASSISSELGVRMQSLVDRRNALVELVRTDMDKFDKTWMRPAGKIATDMKAGRNSIPGIGDAAEAHEAVMSRLDNCAESCTALQHEEHLMAEHLDMLRRELETRR